MSEAIKGLYKRSAIPPADWTIIIYLNGESDLLDDVKRNYNQLAKFGGELGKVNFIVLFDGLKVPKETKNNLRYKELSPRIYYVSRFENFAEDNHLEEFPKLEDLTRPGNLARIIRRVKSKFPAKKYGYIYNGHAQAGGPSVAQNPMMVKLARLKVGETEKKLIARLKRMYQKEGWVFSGLSEHVDNKAILLAVFEKEKSERFLSYQQMGIELKRSGFNRENDQLGFVCLDCCWGQTLETAECFKNVTRYLVASPDEAAVFGIGYDDFAEFMLKKHSTIRYDELANNLVGIYFKHNYDDYLGSDEFSSMGVSLSCIDLGSYTGIDSFGWKTKDVIWWKFAALAKHLYNNLPALWKVVSWSRRKCVDYTYTKPNEYCVYNIDLMWFVENLLHYNILYGRKSNKHLVDPDLHRYASRLAMELSMRFIKSNLASNYKELEINSIEPQLGGRGLAITFPANTEQFDLSIYADDGVFKGNVYWRKFLQRFAAIADGHEKLTTNKFTPQRKRSYTAKSKWKPLKIQKRRR